MQFNKTLCPCLRRAVREIQDQEQTQEVRLSDAMPDIGRVLGAWGQAMVRGKEWRSNGMTVSGGVMAWVLYVPEDGSEARCVEAWIPFQMKWDFPDSETDGTISAACLLRSVDARSTSARKLMVRAGVSVLAEALEPVEAEIFAPGEMPEDVRSLRRSYPIRCLREAGETIFLMDEDLMVPASCPKMQKLIRYELQPEIIDQKVMSGKVVFRGTGILHTLYRGEDGELYAWDFEIPFSEFTDLEREYDQEAGVRVHPLVTSLELELEEDDRLRLKAGLAGQYQIFDRVLVETVEDAYSPARPVTPQMQPLEMSMILDVRRESIRGEQQIEGAGSRIVDAVLYLDQPRQKRLRDAVTLEVPGVFQVLYYDAEGVLQSGIARWEGSWELPVDAQGQVEASVVPTGRPQAVLSGGAMNVRGDVLVDAVTAGKQGIPMMTGLDVGEIIEPDPNRPSLILRRMGEDRLWDIAKACGSTVEAIREANHILDEPDAGQFLLIPVS